MTESKKGPFWGGSAEKRQIAGSENKAAYEKIKSSFEKDLLEIDDDIAEIDRQIAELKIRRANLEQESEHTEELAHAVRTIDKLFDKNNFEDLNDHLYLLKEAQVPKIQIGKDPENNLTIDEILSFIKGVVKEYSTPKAQKEIIKGIITKETLEKAMEERGITPDRISSESRQGLRDCLITCVMKMVEQPVDQTGVVSRESIIGSDLKNIEELRKKIKDK
jgi:hypothetical protein